MPVVNTGGCSRGRPINQSYFSESFRKQVFKLLHLGYEQLTPDSYSKSEEQVITGELIKAINDVLEANEAPEWTDRFDVHDDRPIYTQNRKGKYRRRVDIEFVKCITGGKRPRYQFEAKRLKDKYSYGDYLGKDGLGCFFAGANSYALDSDEAGMLGYVQWQDKDYWQQIITDKLAVQRAHYLLLESESQCTPATLKGIPNKNIFETRHYRENNKFTVYHIFLSFK